MAHHWGAAKKYPESWWPIILGCTELLWNTWKVNGPSFCGYFARFVGFFQVSWPLVLGNLAFQVDF